MNPNYKRAWIDALRSGEYTQGTTYLKRYWEKSGTTTHCCLGVLCVVGKVKQHKPDSLGRVAFDGDNVHLTKALAKKFGLDQSVQEELMTMNDQDGKSFAEIADYIEKNL